MGELKYCRVCLVTDVKMFSLDATTSNSIGVVYSHLVRIPIFDGKPHVCFECASQLNKYQKFKSKCLRAHNILSRLKTNSKQITKQVIQNVDRKINKLESTLILSPVALGFDMSLNASCIHDNIGTEINEMKLKEDKEIESVEGNIKIEETCDVESDGKGVLHESLNEFHDDDFIDSTEDITPVRELRRKRNSAEENMPVRVLKRKHKSKSKKEPKPKSEDDFSDDEPLSKHMIDTVERIDKPVEEGIINFGYFDDYATVMFLTPEDARKEVLLRKDSSNYKNSPFKCDLCYRGYEAKAAFENHMRKHNIEYGDYECDICHLRFPQQIYLCKHKLSCHKRKFSCKLCSYICYCTYQAKNHVNLHKGKKYPCKHCGEKFSMPNSLLMHKRMKHLEESVGESVCEHCGSSFVTARGLFLHNKKVHRQDKNEKLGPVCEDCDVHFSSEVAWKRHLVLSSKHIVSNGCKYCGDTFSNMAELKSHMRGHSHKHFNRRDAFKLPVTCAICDKWLPNRVEYKIHVTSEHPHTDEAKMFSSKDQTPFVCEVCGQMFKLQCFLTYHQRKHTGERPYKCHECGKTFQLAGALSIHSSIHNRKRAHKCDMCGRVFTFKSALNKHIKGHLGIRPHKCAICDKGFIHLCDLKLHIKCVHDKMPWPKRKSKRNITEDGLCLDNN